VYSGLQFKTTKGLELNSQGVFRSSVQTQGLSGRDTVFVQCKFGWSKLAAATRLLLSKDRCLVQSCSALLRRRGRLGEIPPGLIS